MSRDLATSVVVITGASSGIGRAAGQAFARLGSRLVLGARSPEPLRAVAAECERLGAQAVAIPTDVRDEAAVEALFEEAGRVELCVANAGMWPEEDVAVADLLDALERCFADDSNAWELGQDGTWTRREPSGPEPRSVHREMMAGHAARSLEQPAAAAE